MTEVWLVVTLCLAAAPAPSAGPQASPCVDYRSDRPYRSLAACNANLGIIESWRPEGAALVSSLCSRRIDPERIARMPVLPASFGRPI